MANTFKNLSGWLERSAALRRLDGVAFGWALGLGVFVGLFVVVGSALAPTWAGLVMAGGAAVVGGALVWTGRLPSLSASHLRGK